MICLSNPYCGLDLECGNLTLVCDTPTHYALSFGEDSSNLLEKSFSYYTDLSLGAI